MGTSLPENMRHLSEIALSLVDCAAVEEIAIALESSKLTSKSTAAIRGAVAHGNSQLEQQLKTLQELWSSDFSTLSGAAIATALRACADGIQLARLLSPKTQVVWTGPKVEGSYVRATREVVREIVRDADRELIILGYWLAARDDGEGIIAELIGLLSEATARGVVITMVLDERKRLDGTDNRRILIDAWPAAIQLPRLLTWKLPADDKHLKLHAKVIVADQRDALVTSANLTWYAMDRNIEMGVRIVGPPAAIIGQHIKLLDQQGTLHPF